VTEEDSKMIKEILINKIDKLLEVEDSQTKQPEEQDLIQEDSRDKLVELHLRQLARLKMLRCLKRR
jgi:hypothetical protein